MSEQGQILFLETGTILLESVIGKTLISITVVDVIVENSKLKAIINQMILYNNIDFSIDFLLIN